MLSLLLAFQTSGTPLDPAAVCLQARRDADRTVERYRWLGAGALTPFIGSPLGGAIAVALSYFITPSVPLSSLEDLPSSYSLIYSTCYRNRARILQLQYTTLGCALSSLLLPLLYLPFIRY